MHIRILFFSMKIIRFKNTSTIYSTAPVWWKKSGTTNGMHLGKSYIWQPIHFTHTLDFPVFGVFPIPSPPPKKKKWMEIHQNESQYINKVHAGDWFSTPLQSQPIGINVYLVDLPTYESLNFVG